MENEGKKCTCNYLVGVHHKDCPSQNESPRKRGMMESLVEECVGIRGEKTYDGSYAAPREAFERVLKKALSSYKRALLEKQESFEDAKYFIHQAVSVESIESVSEGFGA